MKGREIQEKCSTCYVPAPACGRGGDDHLNDDMTRVFGVAPLEQDEEKGEEKRGEKTRRAAMAAAPLRPSKQVGWAIKEEGQVSCRLAAASHLGRVGRASCCYSFSLARLRTDTNARCASTMSRRYFVRTYVRIRERARYNSGRTTWLMPLAGVRSALNPLSHARILDTFRRMAR